MNTDEHRWGTDMRRSWGCVRTHLPVWMLKRRERRAPIGPGLIPALIALVILPMELAAAPVSGDAVIRAPAGESEIVIKTSARTAGAIASLQWNGKEFLNATDHGRELQTCWNGNAGIEPIADETFNPTEAGSLDDGSGATSSSQLREIKAHGNELETFSQPAFWLSPTETAGGKPARNKTVLSDDRLRKRVVI